ncbi:MAG: RNA pseudouridine synthase [Bacteroidales bacterium]|nr:MAG: RNA pseudouridine synthase [Bacteroidales bacterium]
MNFTSDRILFEDNHLIAVYKTNNDIVQSDKTGDEPLIEQIRAFIKQRDKKPGNVFLEVIHRIDRPVSGVVLFAKTSKVLPRMNKLFHDGLVTKIYWAVVKNMPPKESDTLIHYLLRNSKQNKSYVYDTPKPESKEARLNYKVVGKTNTFYLLEIELITGRHHQIRSQLAKIGCPIKGDLKYGFPRSNPDGGIHLHSRKVGFVHPVTNEAIEIIAQPPQDVLWKEFLFL